MELKDLLNIKRKTQLRDKQTIHNALHKTWDQYNRTFSWGKIQDHIDHLKKYPN